jgi:hypothetical protein
MSIVITKHSISEEAADVKRFKHSVGAIVWKITDGDEVQYIFEDRMYSDSEAWMFDGYLIDE